MRLSWHSAFSDFFQHRHAWDVVAIHTVLPFVEDRIYTRNATNASISTSLHENASLLQLWNHPPL